MPPEPSGSAEPVLAEGRLHPAFILLAALTILRKNGFVLVVLVLPVVTGDWSAFGKVAFVAALTLGFLVLLLGLPTIEYFRYRYRLSATELYIRTGLLSVKERRIPVSRIQDISTEQGPLQRLLGVASLSVQTSSTKGAEASLDCVALAQADEFRDAIRSLTEERLAAAAGTLSDDAPRVADAAPGQADHEGAEGEPLLRIGRTQLLLRGLTDNRAGLVLAGALAMLNEVLELGDLPVIASALERARVTGEGLWSQDPLGAAAVVAVVAASLLVSGWIASAIVSFVRFHGFVLTETGGVFHRRYGLLTKRAHALPRHRIQAIRLEQSPLRRLVRIGVLKAEDMGSGAQEKSARESGTDAFVPVAAYERLVRLMPIVHPAARLDQLEWRATSPRIVARQAFRGLVLSLLIGGTTWSHVGPRALLALLLIPLAAAWGIATYRTLRWAVTPKGFAVRSGVFSRRLAFVPLTAVQAVRVHRTLIERFQRLSTLRVIVGGGARFTVPNLPEQDASELADRVGQGAIVVSQHPATIRIPDGADTPAIA